MLVMILIIIIDFLQIFDTVSQHHLNICVILIKYTYLISLILSVLCFSKENFTFFFWSRRSWLLLCYVGRRCTCPSCLLAPKAQYHILKSSKLKLEIEVKFNDRTTCLYQSESDLKSLTTKMRHLILQEVFSLVSASLINLWFLQQFM